jgi:putative hemolysin
VWFDSRNYGSNRVLDYQELLLMSRKTASQFAAMLLVCAIVWLPQSVHAGQIEATPVAPSETPVTVESDAPASIPTVLQPASDFCLIQSGVLVERFPFVGTNTSTPVRLDGSRWFCEFTGGEGADPPTSRISIGLSTLYADAPTLAAIAYLSKPPVPEVVNSSSLAVDYCARLGGSSQFGSDPEAGGGWASDISNPNATAIGVCVFPDGSAIDDWGLTYHAQGTIRGADLTQYLKSHSGDLPVNVFPAD